jgi:hypothetical protein
VHSASDSASSAPAPMSIARALLRRRAFSTYGEALLAMAVGNQIGSLRKPTSRCPVENTGAAADLRGARPKDSERMRLRIAVLTFSVAMGGCVGPFSEMVQSEYSTADAAKVADPSGWMPDVLPDDATNIREVNRVDSTQTWGCFNTRHADTVHVLLTRLKAHESPGPVAAGPAELFRDFSWWPESMGTGSVQAWEFGEAPPCPACEPTIVRLGIEDATGRVCFH